ncbi:hypothetical protein E2C01_019670 [Portunus trituberculatus]|uniref:Uncharacterized protein n=1 Tax=Portunus trituberculatus TaxID=210409 RepID=A0A5B7DZL0_PORTR|nr:hypothetical protein [Portunus trituberculatus]
MSRAAVTRGLAPGALRSSPPAHWWQLVLPRSLLPARLAATALHLLTPLVHRARSSPGAVVVRPMSCSLRPGQQTGRLLPVGRHPRGVRALLYHIPSVFLSRSRYKPGPSSGS